LCFPELPLDRPPVRLLVAYFLYLTWWFVF
jgi:hypothetical protein